MKERICIFSISFAFNRQLVLNYLEKIFPRNVEIFLFVPKKERKYYHTNRAKIVETNCNKYTSFFELREFCRKNKIQRIMNLGCLPQEGFIMAFASFLTNTEFICHYVENPVDSVKIHFDKWGVKSLFSSIFAYPFALFPKRIIIPSKDITALVKKYVFFARKKIFQIPVTVDTEIFRPKMKSKIRKKLHINQKKKVIIFVGRIEYLKGSDIILELAKRNKDIQFILIGNLSDKIFKENKYENIKIFSFLSSEELSDYYSASDLCLSPSRLESFGIVPRESMACGVPAMVTNITGFKLISPAIKVNMNLNQIEQEIHNFFNLSNKEKKRLSSISRNFILKECSDSALKEEYIEKILC